MSDTETILAAVTAFADKAHGDQVRKYTPERYIEHPKRVMETCRQYTHDVAILSAALMHDVLEDTPVTAEEIRRFLSGIMDEAAEKRTVALVQELTDVYVTKNYPKWNRRKRKAKEAERMEKTSPAAQSIKYADIMDNCDAIVYNDREFAGVFLNECRTLLKKMNLGNKELYQRAVQMVDNALLQLKGGSGSANSSTN
jgi:(p)ppGpp synthase/HD superfamily hydrolase